MADNEKEGASQEPETSKIKRDKLTLKKMDPDKAPEAPSETRLSDPAARRETNTASLKRIRPKTSIGDTTQTDDRKEDTETIHLKVIKEKKNINQLKNLLSASQTIRLRPSTGASAPAAPVGADDDSTTSSAGGEGADKKTLKIKAPASEEDRVKTESIGRAPLRTVSGGETQAAPAAKSDENPTTKISSKSTLKIKAPPGATDAPKSGSPTDVKKKSTLKIKSPVVAAPSAETVKQEPPSSAETVKQEAPTSGKTLKLKSRSSEKVGDQPKEVDDDAAAPTPAAKSAPAPREAIDTSPAGGGGSAVDVVLGLLNFAAAAAAAYIIFSGLAPFS